MKAKRCGHDILRDILGFLQEPRKKTQTMQSCNLNADMTETYLGLCLSNGLIVRKDSFMRITEKGHRLLHLLMLMK